MPIKTDAQALRSKEWMQDALIALMKEKQFGHITISELAERAGLDRRTFYRHYKSKEEVIAGQIQQLAGLYEGKLRSAERMNTHAIALAFYTICWENREFLQLLWGHQLLSLLLYELYRLFPHIHAKYHFGEDLYAPLDTEYSLAYHVGGFWSILNWWLSNNMDKRPEELATIVAHMLPEYI